MLQPPLCTLTDMHVSQPPHMHVSQPPHKAVLRCGSTVKLSPASHVGGSVSQKGCAQEL